KHFRRPLKQRFRLVVTLPRNAKLPQPHGSRTPKYVSGKYLCFFRFRQYCLVGSLYFRESTFFLVEPYETHVAAVDQGLWLRGSDRRFQLILENAFRFTIFALLLVHNREAVLGPLQIRRIRGRLSFCDRTGIKRLRFY